jgi:hypothetical protein
LVVVMTAFAVATPHALILTVSHVCCSANPLICSGNQAAVFTFANTTLHRRTNRDFPVLNNAALTNGFAVACKPLAFARHIINARLTDEISRSEYGDLVCRPIRLSLFRLSFHLACAANLVRGTPLSEGHS